MFVEHKKDFTSSDSESTMGTCCHGSLKGAKGMIVLLQCVVQEGQKQLSPNIPNEC